MPFSRRPLTGLERVKPCPWCAVEPGQRCVNPDGSLFQPGVHAARRTGKLIGRPRGKVTFVGDTRGSREMRTAHQPAMIDEIHQEVCDTTQQNGHLPMLGKWQDT